jgi:hypothetical protein
MLKTFATLVLFLSVSSVCLASPSTTKEDLQAVADGAALANGSFEIHAYNVERFDVEAAKKKVRKIEGIWKNCGPWKHTEHRRETIAMVKKVDFEEGTAGKQLEKLYAQKRIKAMFGAKSNSNIECSITEVHVYTNDGYFLELYYSQGD